MRAAFTVAWLQLIKERQRLLAAVAGVAFAVVLMLVQMGFEDALLTSSGTHLSSMNCDLVLVSPEYQYVLGTSHFSERKLYQALSFEEVDSVEKLYLAPTQLKNPRYQTDRAILVIGFQPARGVLNIPGLDESIDRLRDPDTALFDERCRPDFGPIPADFRKGVPVEVELIGRKMKVVGLFGLGTSFGVDGNVIVSDQQFFRIFGRDSTEVDIGLVRLKPGAEPERMREKLQRLVGPTVRVATHAGIVERERNYWATDTPIGFIFRAGLALGVFVGLIIVYQILYADVTGHLGEYATLKAMGYRDGFLAWIVVQESVILSVFGFLPGFAIALWVYRVAASATLLPLQMTQSRIVIVYLLTLGMCTISGLLAVRKLRSADPAEIF